MNDFLTKCPQCNFNFEPEMKSNFYHKQTGYLLCDNCVSEWLTVKHMMESINLKINIVGDENEK